MHMKTVRYKTMFLYFTFVRVLFPTLTREFENKPRIWEIRARNSENPRKRHRDGRKPIYNLKTVLPYSMITKM